MHSYCQIGGLMLFKPIAIPMPHIVNVYDEFGSTYRCSSGEFCKLADSYVAHNKAELFLNVPNKKVCALWVGRKFK